ncbi:hypothetical protein PTI98_001575 [Pleurotus ostreatus]|nr:hypothetical protein PTI98_001575 [Pleurotus ostreatus]
MKLLKQETKNWRCSPIPTSCIFIDGATRTRSSQSNLYMLSFFCARSHLRVFVTQIRNPPSFASLSPSFSTMASNIDAARAKIAEQVKIDILSKDPVKDNELKCKEIGRTFISDTITGHEQSLS